MPSICLCLTFYKDNWPWRAGQNGELCKRPAAPQGAQLLQGETSSSPGSGFLAKTPCSPPRTAGSSPPSPPEASEHSCVFEGGFFITCTSASQEIRLWPLLVKKLGLDLVILRLHLWRGPQRLRSIKTSNKPKAYGSFSKVHHLYPISCSNCLKPTTEVSSAQEHNPSTRLQTPRYLSQLVPEDKALIYFLDKDLEKNAEKTSLHFRPEY